MIAELIMNITAKQVQQTFSYLVPDGMDVVVGSRVAVPFGHRYEEGIVIRLLPDSTALDVPYTLKEIDHVLSTQAGFQEEMVQTAIWISQYYLCNLADALRLFMVEKKGLATTRAVSIVKGAAGQTDEERQVLEYIKKRGTVSEKTLKQCFGTALVMSLIKRQVLHVSLLRKNTIADKTESWLTFVKPDTEGLLGRRKKQQDLLMFLAEKQSLAVTALVKSGYSRDVIRNLAATGLAKIEQKPKQTTNLVHRLDGDTTWQLTSEQQHAIHIIGSDTEGKTYVLHGVTGSGKTEVYMQLAEKVLAAGKQVIVLVPEIALTGQIVRRFLRRFGPDVVVMHSQLSKGERQNNWRRMATGESHICIGARSAIFTAAQDLGLMIVDEAHDSSYKQDETPRYHAVAVARKRAAYYHCPVILGSATPSIEAYYKAKQGEYVLVELKERVMHRPLPHVTVVDMRDELARGNYRVLSDTMTALLAKTIAAKQQAIILLNRRGFATFVMCRKCGYVVKCDTCDVPMVYHKNIDHLKCHYCDAEKPVPTVCPACGSKYIKFFGTGTEKVEEQLHETFPAARIIRLDQDTTTRKYSGDRIIEAFRRHEYDILLGTQMVAKGHDFADVSAVGILSADSLLNLPAYWAGERTFQLLTQAAGRAGRGDIPGEVVMQTYAPEHYVIQCAKKQDYTSFYTQELAFRQTLLYPPFHRLIKMMIVDENEQALWQRGNAIAQAFMRWKQDHPTDTTEVIGPYVDIIKKVRNKYRIVILLKGANLEDIKGYIRIEPLCWQTGVIIDVDPAW